MVCKNCNTSFEGNFCNQCGQRVVSEKITLKDIFDRAIESFNFDKGFLLTIKCLVFSPSKILKGYLSGERKKYFNPISFFLITLSLNVLIASLSNKEEQDLIKLMDSPVWVLGQIMIILPLLSFFTYLLSRKTFNYAENLTVNLFALGIINLYQIVINLNVISHIVPNELRLVFIPLLMFGISSIIISIYHHKINEKHFMINLMVITIGYLASYFAFATLILGLGYYE